MIEPTKDTQFENLKLPQVIKPPQILPAFFDMPVIFLAGSIEQGVATDWQTELVKSLADMRIVFLNPRREQWDPHWKQDRSEPHFRQQVLWELDGLERADLIVMYIQPETKSPVTLLELGLFAKSKKIIVCCPEGFWRKGNVDIVCEKYAIPTAGSIEELSRMIVKFIA